MTILERLRAATGPDRKLDVRIGYETDLPLPDVDFTFREHIASHNDNYAAVALEADRHASMFYTALPRYTASIDAALALVERILPGWVVDDLSQAARFAGNPWGCALGFYDAANPGMNKMEKSWHEFPTAPLAILTALFAAIEAKEKK